jgi:hypothetical protein
VSSTSTCFVDLSAPLFRRRLDGTITTRARSGGTSGAAIAIGPLVITLAPVHDPVIAAQARSTTVARPDPDPRAERRSCAWSATAVRVPTVAAAAAIGGGCRPAGCAGDVSGEPRDSSSTRSNCLFALT